MRNLLFEPIFHAISLPCLVLKPHHDDFLILEANEAYLAVTESSAEDLVGKLNIEAFPASSSKKDFGSLLLLESFRKVMSTGEKDRLLALQLDIPVRGTTKFKKKYWNVENVPVRKDGEIVYLLHMIHDVTAEVISQKKVRKLRNEARENQQQFRHFVDSNPEGLYSMDLNGRFLHANQGLVAISEVPLDQLRNMSFLPFCLEEDREYILAHFEKAIQGRSTRFEARFVSAKGRLLQLEISLAPMVAEGKIIGAYGIARDLTALRQSQKVVVTKKKYLRANAAFINSLFNDGLAEKSLKGSMKTIGEAMAVDRIFYLLAEPAAKPETHLLQLQMAWARKEKKAQLMDQGCTTLPGSQLGELMEQIIRNKPFNAHTRELPEGTLKSFLQNSDIRTCLAWPVFLKGKLHGLIGLNDCTGERDWSEGELEFVRTLVQNLTASFERRAATEALHRQEEALRLSEKKFKALVQEGVDIITIMDQKGYYTFVSESCRRMLGVTPEELLGHHPLEYIHPQDKDYIEEQLASLDTCKQFSLKPYRFRNKKGEWRWLQTILTNLLDDPAVQGVVGNTRDVTRLLAQELQIRQINERYQLAAKASSDLMYDWDIRTDKVIRFHKGNQGILGHRVEEIDKRHFWAYHIHPDDHAVVLKEEAEVLANPHLDHIQTEYRFLRADGTYAYLIDRAYIIRDASGKAIRMVGATSDISDIKASQEALKEANQRFKLAMKATKEVLWDWDMHRGRIIRGNSFGKITGYGKNDGHDRTHFWFQIVHPEDRLRVQASLDNALQDSERREWKEEYRLVRANGEPAYVMDRGFIVRDASGKAIRMVGSVLDTTETRTTMKKIRQQNQLLREIAWDQSHLLRSPLARMQALMDLLKMEEQDIMSLPEILEHLYASTEELDNIINSIVRKSEQLDLVK